MPPTLGTRSDSNTTLKGLKPSFFNPYRVDSSLGVIPGVGRKKRVQPRALFWCLFRAQSEPASDLGRTDFPSALLSWFLPVWSCETASGEAPDITQTRRHYVFGQRCSVSALTGTLSFPCVSTARISYSYFFPASTRLSRKLNARISSV